MYEIEREIWSSKIIRCRDLEDFGCVPWLPLGGERVVGSVIFVEQGMCIAPSLLVERRQ